MIYILLLYQLYSLIHFSEKIEYELSADAKDYLRAPEAYNLKLKEIQAEINTFLLKSVHTSVSQMQTQNDFYQFAKKNLRLREEIQSLTAGVDFLEELLETQEEQRRQEKENAELLQKRPAVTVLTPHEGEFLRLGGDLSRGREAAAAAFSQKYGVYLILKGHRTLIADPEGRLAENNTGNCGMAKGGSGDVLAGMLLSLLGQGCETFDACCAAVWLHGRAGDLAAADKGERSMTPTDLLEQIPYALKNI